MVMRFYSKGEPFAAGLNEAGYIVVMRPNGEILIAFRDLEAMEEMVQSLGSYLRSWGVGSFGLEEDSFKGDIPDVFKKEFL